MESQKLVSIWARLSNLFFKMARLQKAQLPGTSHSQQEQPNTISFHIFLPSSSNRPASLCSNIPADPGPARAAALARHHLDPPLIVDGKQEVAKDVIESIDEEKRSITFKVVEGDLLKLYKAFKGGFHVETHGGIDLVTWTLEYEKLNEDVEEPLSFLGFCIKLAKDVEAHHLKAT